MTRLLARVTLGCVVLLALASVLMTTLGARLHGPQVVYTAQEVMLYDLRARHSISLEDARLAVPVSLAWSPDGRYIAYYTLSGAAYRLTVLDARTLHKQSFKQALASGAAASWSPDSSRVLVLKPNDSQRADACALHIADFSLMCAALSVNVTMAVWSPRDSLWAMVYYETGKGQCVGVFDVGTQRLQDYECGAAYTRPSWSPDGAQFVYMRLKGSEAAEVVVREVSTAGEKRYRPNVISYIAIWQTNTRIMLESGHRDYALNPQNGKITEDSQDNYLRSATALDFTGQYEAAVMTIAQGGALELLVRRTEGYDTPPIERWRRVGTASSYAFAWRP